MLKVTSVDKDSIASELGFEVGDKIISVNGFPQNDLMDFTYAESGEVLNFSVLSRGGETVEFEIEKDAEEQLGLNFADDEIKPHLCRNNCLFCFVAQLPRGMRKSLYVKDDDWRLSCICGNYVTLTNVSDEEMDRICRMKVGPLYISVHAFTQSTRRALLRNPDTDLLFDRINRLSDAGIALHTQIVMVKGINDGEELRRTVFELKKIENVKSVAVVPVGLTGHRQKLTPLEAVDKQCAEEAISIAESAGTKGGQAFAFCSDEMYIIAEREVPDYEYYGDFCQIENGVGMIASFRKEFTEALGGLSGSHGNYTMLTGVSAEKTIRWASDRINATWQDITTEVLVVKNSFFGESITVTGLLTGQDLASALADIKGVVLLPSVTLRDGVFLDDMTLDELRKKTRAEIIVCDSYKGSGIIDAIASRRNK